MVKTKSKEVTNTNLWQLFIDKFPKAGKYIAWTGRIIVIVFFIDVGYMFGIWPNWDHYSNEYVPQSRFIQNYKMEQSQNPNLPKLRWDTISFDKIPHSMINAVLAAEDHRFFQHGGVDTDALMQAIEYNWNKKRIVYGASTISQQTVKNMFLSGSRNPFRKWHEYLLTFGMEYHLSKKRILEIYLNVAEFGQGIYGIEAAAQAYWGKSAARLTKMQCVELAATLPAPKNHNPRTRSSFFMKQRNKISRNM